MSLRRKYKKRSATEVVAVQLDLETEGFTYRKWGEVQTCKRGDWLLNNDGDIYTVDRETFERTYKAVGLGLFAKTAPVWAEVAESAGKIRTKEGATHYKAGDFLVYNDREGEDGYAVEPGEFERMYEPAPG